MDTHYESRKFRDRDVSPTNSISTHDLTPAVGKKRRTSTSGSRGVANLTPDQLAKKRANDREAQRAIRERTKGQIEALERKIQDLTSQQPYQDLQHIIKQKEAVEAENEDIRRRLTSVLSIVQPILGAHGVTDLIPPIYQHTTGSQPNVSPTLRRDAAQQNAQDTLGSGLQYADNRSDVSSSSTFTALPQASGHISSATYVPHGGTFSSVLNRQTSNVPHGSDPRASGQKLDLGFVLDSRQDIHDERQPAETSRGRPVLQPYSLTGFPHLHVPNPTSSGKGRDAFEAPVHAYSVPPRHTEPTCPLDGLLLDFLAERQQRAAEGVSKEKLIGPAYPSVSSLLNPERSIYSHPLSKVFTDILRTFPDIETIPEQIAVLYIMFLVMRWQISKTQETYDRLPEWMTPRASQLFTPHPAWTDNIPWPRMRDKMVRLYPEIAFDDFFIPYTVTLSLNWPYEPRDTLLSMPDSDELTINPVFERHLRDLSNWSLGPAFAKSFPMLAETTKIKPEVQRRSNP